jgi:hypothetical protein
MRKYPTESYWSLEGSKSVDSTKIISFTEDLSIRWEREASEHEFRFYSSADFLDEQTVITNFHPESIQPEFNLFDIKDYKTLKEFTADNIPYFGDREGEEGIRYMNKTIEVNKNDFVFLFWEIKETSEKDPLTGGANTSREYLDQYYYKFDINTYEIIEKGKLQ